MNNTQEAQEKHVKEAMEVIYSWAKANDVNFLSVTSNPQKEDGIIKIHMAYTTSKDERFHNIILYKEKSKPKINYLKRLNEFLRHKTKGKEDQKREANNKSRS